MRGEINSPELGTGRADAVAQTAVSNNNGFADTAPIFAGDRHGIGAILDTDHSTGHGKKHFNVPRAPGELLKPEDLHYLKIKGCFSLPDDDICDSIIQCYFRFFHPGFPIIDATSFSDAYVAGGIKAINLLLVWSIFSVATSVWHPGPYQRYN